MKNPKRQPGYQFASMRLMRADYQLLDGPATGDKGNLDVDYGDQVDVQGQSVVLRQRLHVRILSSNDESKTYLDLRVDIEGTFVATPGANLDPTDFGNNHAPAILFAFTREWVHRLTSAAGPWPPILLPPVNVLQLRKQPAAEAK